MKQKQTVTSEQSQQPGLSLVILNYNSQFWLKKTLTTLKAHYLDQTQTQVQTIVVDNNSTDDSVTMVKQEFAWVELIESKQNLGFAAGNNLALKQIKTPYVMLLNNDVEFSADSNLDILLQFMEQNPQVAVCTPKLTLANGNLDQACHRGEPTLWAGFTYHLGLEKLFPQSEFFAQYHQTYKPLDQVHEVDACSGAAMLIRVKHMQQVGLLDERFFMYAEDLDWCKRFREQDYKVAFVPHCQLTHHKYKSGIKTESDLTATQTKQHFYNTMLQYYDKHYQEHYPRFYRWLLRAFIFIKKDGM